jgi:hypothetical protein
MVASDRQPAIILLFSTQLCYDVTVAVDSHNVFHRQGSRNRVRFSSPIIFRVARRAANLCTSDCSKEAGATNPRGIPYAPFVDKVEDYVTSREEVEGTLRQFQEMISKYQFMELNLQRRVSGLNDKMPDIQKTLETVRFLKTRTV